MTNKLVISLLGSLFVFSACERSSRVVLPADEVISEKMAKAPIQPKEKYFLGHVQVMTKEASWTQGEDQPIQNAIANVKTKYGISAEVINRVPNEPIYLLEIPADVPVDVAVKAFRLDSEVVMADRHHEITLSDFRSNDPQLPQQWALGNMGQDAPRALAGRTGADIAMPDAGAEGSYDVVVGVVDTGIDYFHEDLAVTDEVDGKRVVLPGSNIWMNPAEIPGNGINDDNNGDPKNGISYIDDVYGYNFVRRNGDPMDDQGHGTHVSGTIGALRDNLKGVSGVVKKVSLMGLKFLDADGSGGDFNAQLAIYYAIDMQKRFPEKKFILQNSWGSAGRNAKDGDDSDFLLRAFAKASKAGIFTAVAAGNDGTSNRFDPHFPANYSSKLPGFLTVAATNNLDQLAGFSSYGFGVVQVAAPGTMILSTVPPSIYNGSTYQAWSGTSMATPHVSGLAAAVWAANPKMSAEDVKKRIVSTVDILPQLHGAITSSGRINVKRALSGDINISLPKIYEEVPQVVESPRGEDKWGFESMTELKAEGAKEVTVCFSRINLDDNLDWIEVMGSDYRVRDTMTGTYEAETWTGENELCAAPVLGDTVYLRLVNQGASGGPQGFETKYLKVLR